MNFRKLLPESLGGEHYYNYWNLLCMSTITKWTYDRRERPFVELVRKVNPKSVMEIGVLCGWSAERIIKSTSVPRNEIEYYGFDLFKKCAANRFISTPIDDISKKLSKLGVSKVWLFAGDSRETLPIIVPTLPKMDFIYIDGGHSYEVCKSDWENVRPLVHPHTTIVLDDYLGDGVKRVVSEIPNPPYIVEFLNGFHPKAVVTMKGVG